MSHSSNEPVFGIMICARLTKTPVRMLREYETRGLIRPKRINGQRRYARCEIDFIGRMRQLIDEAGMNINSLKVFILRAVCWQINQCNNKSCPSFGRVNKPCWLVVKHHGFCSSENCALCPIYLVKTLGPAPM